MTTAISVTPETPLADLFAMDIETLTVVKVSSMHTTVSLRVKGGNRVQVQGAVGADWRTVLAEAMLLAVEDRRAHGLA